MIDLDSKEFLFNKLGIRDYLYTGLIQVLLLFKDLLYRMKQQVLRRILIKLHNVMVLTLAISILVNILIMKRFNQIKY